MSTGPKVSICVPTFNRREYLRQCLDSVAAQDYPHLEVIVGDNASEDGTAEFLKERKGLQVIRHATNLGMVPNWNSCLAAATGEWVLLLSDDDILLPDAVRRLVAAVEGPGVAFAYSTVQLIDPAGRPLGVSHAGPAVESSRQFIAETLGQARVPYPSALLFRLGDARRIGGFTAIANQTDVAFRMLLAAIDPTRQVVCISEPLVHYRVHPGALTTQPELKLRSRIEFEGWILRHPEFGRTNCQMAYFDLLLLGVKHCPGAEQSPVRAQLKGLLSDSAIGQMVGPRLAAMGARVARGEVRHRILVCGAMPILCCIHLLRFVSNRRYHRRF